MSTVFSTADLEHQIGDGALMLIKSPNIVVGDIIVGRRATYAELFKGTEKRLVSPHLDFPSNPSADCDRFVFAGLVANDVADEFVAVTVVEMCRLCHCSVLQLNKALAEAMADMAAVPLASIAEIVGHVLCNGHPVA